MKNIADMMKKASQMQAKMAEVQAELERLEIDGQSGAGMVAVTLRGKGELVRVKIDPKLADPAEMEMLEDLIIAAHADAKRKLDARVADDMAKVTAGLPIPPGMKFPF
jgi:DNA-binding YbaB/EbfC family protein